MVTSGGFFEVLLNEIFHYRQFLQHFALEKALFDWSQNLILHYKQSNSAISYQLVCGCNTLSLFR